MTARRTLEERIAIVILFSEFKNCEEVRRQWHKQFNSNPPSIETIKLTFNRFLTTGYVVDEHRSGRPITTTTPERVQQVQELVLQSPNTSVNSGAALLEISKTSYLRIMRKLNFKPYLPQHVPALKPEDFVKRQQFSGQILALLDSNQTVIDHILWSDESVFYLSGTVSRHNDVRWGPENPHEQNQVPHSNQSVMVWCGLTSTNLVGPHFFEGPVDRYAYLNLLNSVVWPFSRYKRLIFQQDGAPAHYALDVRNWLDNKFPGKWIGRDGPYEWPARSPDLAPCDFFLWGYLKSLVYRTRPATIAELRARIIHCCGEIPIEFLERACHATRKRFEECIALEGHQLSN